MKTIQLLLASPLVCLLLASCSSSSSLTPLSIIPTRSWDAALHEKSPVVLRVEIIPGYENLRQHRMFPVRVIQTYKNSTDIKIPKTLEVASTAEWGGLPASGKCTIYLKPNASKTKSAPPLALDEPSGVYIQKHTPAYSHHTFPKDPVFTDPTPEPQTSPDAPAPDAKSEPAQKPEPMPETKPAPKESLTDFAKKLTAKKEAP